jgi:protoporphyrinogen oxidase
MRIAIIGAGPAGLTAAYCLSKFHANVDVYETADTVGGLARSLQLWNQTVDLGPHRFFSRDKRVNELWLEVVQGDYCMVKRLTRILYKGKFYSYPLRTTETLVNLGPMEASKCLASYAREHLLKRPQNGTFEAWVCSRFGRRMFEIFFKTYSEKLWGIRCDDLDADFAAQRIKQFSLSEAIKNALSIKTNMEHRTLADEFAYPSGGTGMVYRRMESAVLKNGGRIFLKKPVRQVMNESGHVRGIELSDGTVHQYDQVISSMPLTTLVSRIKNAPSAVVEASRELSFRNTILVYLEIAANDLCQDNWIYIHSPELHTGRITNFRNWAPQLYGESQNTILSLEYWCNENDVFWNKSDDELLKLARRELELTHLVRNELQIRRGTVYRIPKCYPIYRRGYKSLLQPIQDYLAGIKGLQVIGRYGSFKYNNQDHSILMGILAAENSLSKASHNLWNVNSDYDTYQEGWTITETGLVQSHKEPVDGGD